MLRVRGGRVKGFRFDGDAAIWFAVAFVAAAFGLLPVLMAGLAATGSALDGWAYIAANAFVALAAYGAATAFLVRARPDRRFRDLIVTFYLLQLAGATALAVLQFIGAPRAWEVVLATMLAPLTFGAIQVVTISPFKLAEPDVWAALGVCIGFAVGRGYLRMRGRASGAAADTKVTPMRLPSPPSRDTINTHT